MASSITAHCLVKNEARFVWYSVMSVINHVDKVIIYDTGSTDGTLEIINEIKKSDKENKVNFREYGEVSNQTFYRARQDMLNETKTDWILVVDGDEIWWDESIKKVISEIKNNGNKIESIIVPTINLVGDMYHFQDKSAGQYKFGNLKGHYNLRALKRNIPGLHSQGTHGIWGWVDKGGMMIQERGKFKFIDSPYLHATHLPRSMEKNGEFLVPKRAQKLKHEIGLEFAPDFYYPEALFRSRPNLIPSVWFKMDNKFRIRSYIETPFRKIKRKIFKGKAGY